MYITNIKIQFQYFIKKYLHIYKISCFNFVTGKQYNSALGIKKKNSQVNKRQVQIQKTDQLHAGESKCSLLMRLHESCGFGEENVKISDDSCLSPGNSVQQSVREGWSSQVHLEKNNMIDDPSFTRSTAYL